RAYTHLVSIGPENRTELSRHQAFLRALGLQANDLQPRVWTQPEDDAFADGIFAEHDLQPEQTIALFPGAQHDCKVYPRLADAVQNLTGFRFVILGGANEVSLASHLQSALPNRCVNLAGQTTLLQMAAIIRKCRLYVGADSAGAHMACAVGTPNVVVVGGGHFGRFLPYSPLTSAVALPLDCYGCNWACRFERPHCVKDIDSKLVSRAISDALNGPSQKPRLYLQNNFDTA